VGYELQDLGTSNGTFVNGIRISRTRLQSNDRIQIGSTVFMFQEKEKS
jgi:pSer/pThr/pTyr-binding forkhead associated (FHA) protein